MRSLLGAFHGPPSRPEDRPQRPVFVRLGKEVQGVLQTQGELMKKIPGTRTEYAKHARPYGKRRANKQVRPYVKRALRDHLFKGGD